MITHMLSGPNGIRSSLLRKVTLLNSFALCLTVFTTLGDAQNAVLLQGTVTNRNTGQPVSAVTVKSCGGCKTLTTTDANGVYSLDGTQASSTSGTLLFQGQGYFAHSQAYTITTTPTQVNATLLPGGVVLQGTVTDASTQQGIVGATLSFYPDSSLIPADGGNTLTALTGAAGAYSLDSSHFMEAAVNGFQLDSSSLFAYVSAPGYLTFPMPTFTATAPYPFIKNFSLTPSNATVIRGTITDRSTGRPLSGVTVKSCDGCKTLTTTDANGIYSLDGTQASSTSGTLLFQGQGYFAHSQAYTITTTPTQVNATLLPGGIVLQGTVTDASTQQGIVGATLSFYPDSSLIPADGGNTLTALTGAAGAYSLDSSHFKEAAVNGFQLDSYALFAYVSAPGYLTFPMPAFMATPPYPFIKNFSLTPSNATVIRGTITDRSTGRPLSGVTVKACAGCKTLTTTDANGIYSLDGTQASSTSGTLLFQGQAYFAHSQVYTITTTPTQVNATLLPGGIVLQGTATDASTQQGIVGATLSFYPDSSLIPADGGITLTALTGASGAYSLDSSHFMEAAVNGFQLDSYALFAYVSAPGYLTFPMPAFMATPPYPFTKNFALTSNGVTNQITVVTAPTGLNISVDGTNYTAPQTFQWPTGSIHTLAVASPQGSGGTRYTFTQWSDGGTQSHQMTIAQGAATYTASFNTQYQLTTAANPLNAGSITPGGWFNAGSTVSIKATPNAGYQFNGFSGGLTGMTNPQMIVMNAPATVTAMFTQVVQTTTILTSSAVAPVYGANLTFYASVSPSAATGAVTFFDGNGSIPLGTANLAGGSASFTISNLIGGSHTITAVYQGDANYLGSTSSALSISVAPANTVITVSATPNPATAGQPVNVTATVSPATAEGMVQFYDGTTLIGTNGVIAAAGGKTTIGILSATAGNHSLTAVYPGNGNYKGSTSPILSLTVNAPLSLSNNLGITLQAGNTGAIGSSVLKVTDPGDTDGWLNGSILVAHQKTNNTHVISQISPSGALLRQFGTDPIDRFRSHLALSGGLLYRSNDPYDAENIVAFDSTGQLVRTIVVNSSAQHVVTPITRDATGASIYFVDTFAGNNVIRHLTDPATGANDTLTSIGYNGAAGVQDLYFGGPVNSAALYALSATSPTVGPYRIAKYSAGTVQFFDGPDLTVPYVTDVGTLAVDPSSGTVYVGTGSKILSFDASGRQNGSFPFTDTKPAIDVDQAGNIYAAHFDSNSISVLSPTGALVRAIAMADTQRVIRVLVAPGPAIVYTLTAAPVHGALTLAGVALQGGATFTQGDIEAGALSYRHEGSGATSDSFYYTASNGLSTISNTVFPITVIPAGVDLEVASNTAAPLPPTVAANLTYTVVVTNRSASSTATGVTLTNRLQGPQGNFWFIGMSATQGSCSGTGAGPICNLGTLAPGASATFTMVINPAATGTISNTAQVTANESDPNTSNNSLTASYTVVKAATTTTLASNVTSAVYGANVTFTVSALPSSDPSAFGGREWPTGQITLFDGGGTIQLGTASLANGSASFTISNLSGGSHSITTVYAGDGNYIGSNSAAITFTVNKADQTITFGALPGKTYGDPPVIISATASSGLPISFGAAGACTVSGNTVTISGAGSCTITASQVGDNTYNAATSLSQTFAIAKADQTILFPQPPDRTYGEPTFFIGVSASSKMPVSLSSSGPCYADVGGNGPFVSLLGAGTCTVIASQTGDGNYNAALSVSRTFSIAKAGQSILFSAIPSKTYGDSPFTISAVSTSALPVSFNSTGSCTVSARTATITGAGTCTITATQAGDDNYKAATPVSQSFAISKAVALLSFDPASLNQVADANEAPRVVTVTTVPAGLGDIVVTYNGVPSPPIVAGTYAVAATLNNLNYQGSATAQMVLSALPPPPGSTTQTFSVSGTPVTTGFTQLSPDTTGTTTVVSTPPPAPTDVPTGFVVSNNSLAFQVSTSMSVPQGSKYYFCVMLNPMVDSQGNLLHILHGEQVTNADGTTSTQYVDRTVTDAWPAPPADSSMADPLAQYRPNTTTGQVCAQTDSFSPFVVARSTDRQGPVVSGVSVGPNPAPVGTTISLHVDVNDSSTGGSRIQRVEYSLDGGNTWSTAGQFYTVPTASVNASLTLNAGVYAVCVRAIDAALNATSVCTDILAVYDASAGFVTGGGWISSPAGAYYPNASLTGKATFGFVSKYQKGATVPSGDTQFQFQVANLNFRSTQYDWLVIAGARAQFKGSGSLTGAINLADCGFLLTAIDGQVSGGGGVDKFRIKIWDKASGNIVYDNQLGASDTGNAATELGGGSIIIHK